MNLIVFICLDTEKTKYNLSYWQFTYIFGFRLTFDNQLTNLNPRHH